MHIALSFLVGFMKGRSGSKVVSHLGSWWLSYLKAASLAIRGMGRDNISLMASGMVYSTLIAVIPCFTFLFAFLSAFGVLQPFMELIKIIMVDTFGEGTGAEIVSYLELFSSNAMSLGVIGLISFIFTGILLVNKIYTVINSIFRTHPSSGTVRRFTSFLTLLILGAFMVVALLAIRSMAGDTLRKIALDTDGDGSLFYTFLLILIGWGALLLLYKIVPSSRIKFGSAAVGATTCIISLTIATAAFRMIASTMVSYSVIYGSLATLFIALLYLYIVWFSVFFAAELAFVYQFRPDKTFLLGNLESPFRQISEAVNTLLLISDKYRRGDGAMSQKELIRKLAIPAAKLGKHISDLEDGGMIMCVNTQRTLYVPARPLDQIKLSDVIVALYGESDDSSIETMGEAVAAEFMHRGVADTSSVTVENLLERI